MATEGVRKKSRGRKPIDHKNRRYGRLFVKKMAKFRGRNGMIVWLCDCDCGTKSHPVVGDDLRKGNTTSCGCYRKEVVAAMRIDAGVYAKVIRQLFYGKHWKLEKIAKSIHWKVWEVRNVIKAVARSKELTRRLEAGEFEVGYTD